MTISQGWFFGRTRVLARPQLIALSALAVFAGCGNRSAENPSAEPPYSGVVAASRVFSDGRVNYAPADFQRVSLTIQFDVPRRKATGAATIQLRAAQSGRVYFLSEAPISAASLDGQSVSIETKRDPDNLNDLRVVARDLAANSVHELKVEYAIPASRVSFTGGGVGFLTSMSDITRGNYFEAYGPANFEDDAFALDLELELIGATNTHKIFSNGIASKVGDAAWHIQFPAYYVSSSFYIHLTDTAFAVRTGQYRSVDGRDIPLTVYARSAADAQNGIDMLPGLFAELESTFGTYAHSSFTALISGSGGMEHVGATVTSLSALGHELTHSWFARGVMPSDGRSGWIDEAIASWRDNGYFRATSSGTRAPTNLARFSAFSRFAPSNSYVDGRRFLSELDFLFANQGGLKPVLRTFFSRFQRRNVHNADFRALLEESSQMDLDSLFRNYVFGTDPSFEDRLLEAKQPDMLNMHPPALTQAEVESLR